jgi:putative membrane-bound dehydrogenase-like protein
MNLLPPRWALMFVFFVTNLRAADQDPRMVPPPNALSGKLPSIGPISAREAAKTFRVLDGFRMDLLAAEPLVASPVAMTYDENGRAYVCEMRDYPYTDKAHHQRNQENPTDDAIGTVRLLEDADGDGVFDKSIVFADGLSWPTGVACWKGGVFVAATPDIWYLKDTDGDGQADVRRRVFSGFRKLNVQSVMNNLVWGLDNQIHGAGGSNGGQIRPGDKPETKPLVMTRQDFRFDPVTQEFELLSGGARFGGTFDDWGHRFLCDIRNPAQHVVLPQGYLARNPYLAARSPLHDMAESGDQLPVHRISQPELWRVLRAKRWAGERDIVMPRSELVGAGVVTSSSGITCYRGAAYPKEYLGNVFVCEVAGNLFYRLQLSPDGPTFKAARVSGQAEMVASTDNWFRPVNFINSPDGTLHVVDMYRENIEHPWSIPDDIHAAVDLESGRERGRIWRLAPPGFKASKPPRLGRATTAQLVATLENPNSWWRETAQRLLFERQEQSVVPALRRMVRRGEIPQARLHALWTLAGLNGLTDEDVLVALKDQSAGIRENAVKLAELRIHSSKIRDALFKLVADSNAGVRFQVAFTLGDVADPHAVDALATIARRDASDSWVRAAVLSSVPNTSDQLLARLLADVKFRSSPAAAEMLRQLAQIVGARGKDDAIQRVLEAARKADALLEVAFGVGEGLKRAGRSLRQSAAPRFVDALLDQGRDTALAEAPLDTRVKAIQMLAFDEFERVKEALTGLLAPSQPQEVQRAAIAALGSFSQPEVAKLLLFGWRTYAPVTRAEVIDALLNARSRIPVLLEAVEGGLVPANQVPFARRAALLRSADRPVKEKATKLFANAAPGPRKEVVARYQAALSIKGDAARGKGLFETACATCHRVGDQGKDIGPNLTAIRQWSPEQALINILDPNREVAPNFVGYTVETKDGRTLDGIITDESAASLTIKRAEGLIETVLRRDIAQLSGSGLSLMPEGLESAITVEQMADLLAFLLVPP